MKNFIFYIHNPSIITPESTFSSEDVSFIPPMLRRRMSFLQKESLFLAKKAIPCNLESYDFPSVFASQFGEWGLALKLFKQFFVEKELSPAVFSSSVHNAAAGFFSLLFNNKAEYTTISAGIKTLQMGFLEATLFRRSTLFVYAEEETPDFYNGYVPSVAAHGLSLFLSEKESDFKVKVTYRNNSEAESDFSFDEMHTFLKGEKDCIHADNFSLVRVP